MSDKEPLVTILMPVYNSEQYLAETIDSMLNQSYRNFEFDIINDGSSDKSVQIIQSYSDPRIKLYHNNGNQGLIYTLNRGLEIANGKYIVRMDADDISLPDRLEKQVAYMEKNKNIGISGTWIKIFGNNKNRTKYPITSNEIKACLFWGTTFAHPSVIMRREDILKNNLKYRIEYLHAEDYGFWVEAAQHFDMGNIPEFLLKYRASQGSISNKYKNVQEETVTNIILKNIESLGYSIEQEMRELLKTRVLTIGKLDNIKEIKKIEALLIGLKELNDKNGKYPEIHFNRYLAEKLYRICVKSAKLGPEVIKIYKNSPVGGYSYINLEKIAKLFIRSYFR